MPRRQAPGAILDVVSEFSGSEIATLRENVLRNKRNLRETYYDEVELREGRRRWEFVLTVRITKRTDVGILTLLLVILPVYALSSALMVLCCTVLVSYVEGSYVQGTWCL